MFTIKKYGYIHKISSQGENTVMISMIVILTLCYIVQAPTWCIALMYIALAIKVTNLILRIIGKIYKAGQRSLANGEE